MLQESRRGRYEAHRSLCIRFLSRDGGADDVVWSHVVMRVEDAAAIVCWNQVTERRAAVDLRRRLDDGGEDFDVRDVASGSGPPRPCHVVELEEEEEEASVLNTDRRVPQRHGPTAAPHGEVVGVHGCEPSDTSSQSDRCDVRTQGGREPPPRRDHLRPYSRDVSSGSAELSEHVVASGSTAEAGGSGPPNLRLLGQKLSSRHDASQTAAVTSEAVEPLATDSVHDRASQGCRSSLTARAQEQSYVSSGGRAGTEKPNADFTGEIVCGAGLAQSYRYDECQTTTHCAADRRTSENSGFPDDVVHYGPPTLPTATRAQLVVGTDPAMGTSSSNHAGVPTFLTNPSPPMERTTQLWRHCRILPAFSRRRLFNPSWDCEEPVQHQSTSQCSGCGCVDVSGSSSSLRAPAAAVVSGLSPPSRRHVHVHAGSSRQPASNDFLLPELNAQDVAEVLDQRRTI